MPDEETAGRPGLLTARQVARQLGVHQETVKRWARTGRLEGVKNISGFWLFDQEDINDLPVAQSDRTFT